MQRGIRLFQKLSTNQVQQNSIRLADKFQRRIDKDTTHVTKATLIEYFSYVVCGGLGFYMTIYHDYGYEDHCFQPLRRWYQNKVNSFWTLSEKEKKELQDKEKF